LKAVRFHATGEPAAVLTCEKADLPVPSHGEVLVRMLASPVNPSDLMFVRGVYGVDAELPQSPGFEGVGMVEQSGGGLRGKLFAGKRVVVLNRRGGNWAEHTVVPAQQVIPVGSKLSDEQAATFFVNPATAWVMVREVLKVPRGEYLLQTAAASSLGRMVVRLGNELGFETINIVRRASQAETLRADGAKHVFVFDQGKPAELQHCIEQACGRPRVRYAIDPVGGATGSAVLKSLANYGHMLCYGTLDPAPLQISPRDLMGRAARLEGFWLGRYMDQLALPAKLLLVRRIQKMILSGVLSTKIGATFSLDDIGDAVVHAETPDRSGKTLLRIAATT
jgi:NADPH2:quinone reductase